jgi:hypothetical protein
MVFATDSSAGPPYFSTSILDLIVLRSTPAQDRHVLAGVTSGRSNVGSPARAEPSTSHRLRLIGKNFSESKSALCVSCRLAKRSIRRSVTAAAALLRCACRGLAGIGLCEVAMQLRVGSMACTRPLGLRRAARVTGVVGHAVPKSLQISALRRIGRVSRLSCIDCALFDTSFYLPWAS